MKLNYISLAAILLVSFSSFAQSEVNSFRCPINQEGNKVGSITFSLSKGKLEAAVQKSDGNTRFETHVIGANESQLVFNTIRKNNYNVAMSAQSNLMNLTQDCSSLLNAISRERRANSASRGIEYSFRTPTENFLTRSIRSVTGQDPVIAVTPSDVPQSNYMCSILNLDGENIFTFSVILNNHQVEYHLKTGSNASTKIGEFFLNNSEFAHLTNVLRPIATKNIKVGLQSSSGKEGEALGRGRICDLSELDLPNNPEVKKMQSTLDFKTMLEKYFRAEEKNRAISPTVVQ